MAPEKWEKWGKHGEKNYNLSEKNDTKIKTALSTKLKIPSSLLNKIIVKNRDRIIKKPEGRKNKINNDIKTIKSFWFSLKKHK